jgi:hypothetical protein
MTSLRPTEGQEATEAPGSSGGIFNLGAYFDHLPELRIWLVRHLLKWSMENWILSVVLTRNQRAHNRY